jgi:hypothetical protein
MSASTAIGQVSESLRTLLTDEMTVTPAVPVTVLGPDEAGGDRRINLFLYKVEQNAAFTNMDWAPGRADPTRLLPPPLSVNLYYLLTAYAPNDQQNGNATAHALLGDAMRVLHDNPVLTTASLTTGLDDAKEEIRVFLNPLDLDELSKLWSTFTKPFRTSVLYEVSVVQLDAPSDADVAVPARVRTVGVPDVRAPWAPPTIDSVAPVSGVAGRTLTVAGTHLAGWRATVRLAGAPLVTDVPLTGDTFPLIVPAGLAAGVYELRVDVSRLCRRTMLVEVTP